MTRVFIALLLLDLLHLEALPLDLPDIDQNADQQSERIASLARKGEAIQGDRQVP